MIKLTYLNNFHFNYSSVYRFLLFLLSLILVNFQNIHSGSIHLNLSQAPTKIQKHVGSEMTALKATEKMERLSNKNPAEMERKLLKNGFKKLIPTSSGFIGLYAGYVDYSDTNGNITFPLLHKKPKAYIVVTPQIELVNIYKNTFSHRNFLPDVPAKIYKLERRQDELNNKEGKKITYWNVEEVPKKEHNRISSIAIVILTKPKNIYVPTGDFITKESPNLVLPKIYVVGKTGKALSLSNFLDIRRFFEQIYTKEKTTDKVTQKIIKNN